MSLDDEGSPQEELGALFGSYRAEWLNEKMFDLFSTPSYFPELTTGRPCMLIGGRGTGKTTVLRCLSYEGQYALRDRDDTGVSTWPFYGVYHRVNTNRVTAFRGGEISEDRWNRLFGHYFNLVVVDLLLGFLKWFELRTGTSAGLPADAIISVGATFGFKGTESIESLHRQVRAAQIALEAFVNNAGEDHPHCSLQGAPIDELTAAMRAVPCFAGRHLFILIDEYENYSDHQQRIVNTILKHAGQSYTFKIGVRELGWRARTTINQHEVLQSPADYVSIDVTAKIEEQFAAFGRAVCNGRMALLREKFPDVPADVSQLFPGYTEEKEAEILDQGGHHLAKQASDCLETLASAPSDRAVLNSMPLLERYLLAYWAQAHNQTLQDVWANRLANPREWETRYGNYKYGLLFTLRRRKRGIQKFYCGWDVIVQLAGVNVRYLLELVDQCLLLHLRRGGDLGEPVTQKLQTEAAQEVGRKNLSELEALSSHGAQLTRLILALGRVFQSMAASPEGHLMEVNHFQLADEATEASAGVDVSAADRLISAAVMHLALVRSAGTKLVEVDIRDYEYRVHPVFSAFFVFSHRKRRKMTLKRSDLLGFVDRHRRTIRTVLAGVGRNVEEPLPEQMELFQGFYSGAD